MEEKRDTFLFSRKKIALICVSLVVTIAIIIFTVLEVVKVDFNWIFSQIGSSFHDSRYLWFILLLVSPIYFILYRFFMYWHWFIQNKIKFKWYDCIIFSLFSRSLSIITPLAFASQPFQYFWLRINKVDHYQAIGMITCCSFIEVLVGAVVTWPSFFYIAIVKYHDIIALPSGVGCFYLIVVGMFLDLMMTTFYFLMGYSRRIHVGTSLLANKIFKFLKMKYKTKDQIYYEYKQNAIVKKIFIQDLKQVIDPTLISVCTLVFIFAEYSSMYYSVELLGNDLDGGTHFTYMDIFNSINVATTANNFIPIPGGEGTTQFSLGVFLHAFKKGSDPDLTKDIINGSMTLWRFFAYYLIIFLSVLVTPLVIWYYVKRIRISKLQRNSEEKELINKDNIN